MSEIPFDTPELDRSTSQDESTRPSVTEVPAPRSEQPTPAEYAEAGRPTRLVVKRGPTAGTAFVVTESVTTIGRHRDCDIFLDDGTVSRYHAELRWQGGRYVIADTGSLNGTYLNRRPVDRVALTDGDELWIGKFRFIFRTAG
jgi:pSer/pThr/pTyr-binding forkhead associated (FHA) protein